MRKRRILWVSESSVVWTGFGKISKEILTKLYGTGLYDVAEVGAYVSQRDPRLFSVPWQVYASMPEDNDAEGWDKYRSNASAQFGSDVFENALLDFQPDVVIGISDIWMCVTPYTSILYGDLSYKNIKDIKIGDSIIGGSGNLSVVTKTYNRKYNGDIIKIKSSMIDSAVEMTPNHPVLIIKRKTKSFPRDISKKEFVRADTVKTGDITLFPVPRVVEQRCNFTNEQLFGFGFFVAEGCYLKNPAGTQNKCGIQISGNKSENVLVQKILESFVEIDSNATIYPYVQSNINNAKYRGAYTGRLTSKKIASMFYQWFGEYAKGKSLPEWIMHLPKDQLAWFIKGLINGDGCLSKQKEGRFYTTSRQLAKQTWLCLLRLGIVPALNKGTTRLKNKRFDRYLLNVCSDQYDKFEALFKNAEYSALKHKKIVDNYLLMPVRKVEILKNVETEVYNLEVEGDHTYVSEFITHNCDFMVKSPLRPYYKYIYLHPTDSTPPKDEWLDTFFNADVILAQSGFGKQVLEESYGRFLKNLDVVRPGVNPDIFKPLDKKQLRQKYGLSQDMNLVLSVMRNQRRKLFPDLLDMFSLFLRKCDEQGRHELAQKTFLLLHTSYPDVGFDIPKHILRNGLSHKVIMTYFCKNCKIFYPDFFQSETTVCKRCRALAATMPNTQSGISDEGLCEIYNLADLYIQYSIAGATEMPIAEAKACGLPVFATDYAGMQEQVTGVFGCQPIKVEKFFYEPIVETEQVRALPDNNDCADKMIKFFEMSFADRLKASYEARKDASENYSFDRAFKIFKNAIDSVDISTNVPWDIEPNYLKMQMPPRGLSNADFIDWCIVNILKQPKLLNSYFRNSILRSLNVGYAIDKHSRGPFSKDSMMQIFNKIVENHNFWEKTRTSKFDTINSNLQYETV